MMPPYKNSFHSKNIQKYSDTLLHARVVFVDTAAKDMDSFEPQHFSW